MSTSVDNLFSAEFKSNINMPPSDDICFILFFCYSPGCQLTDYIPSQELAKLNSDIPFSFCKSQYIQITCQISAFVNTVIPVLDNSLQNRSIIGDCTPGHLQRRFDSQVELCWRRPAFEQQHTDWLSDSTDQSIKWSTDWQIRKGFNSIQHVFSDIKLHPINSLT